MQRSTNEYHDAPQDMQTVTPLADGTVAWAMIQPLIRLGLGGRGGVAAGALGVGRLAVCLYRGSGRNRALAGSISLADQKVPITVPPVRKVHAGSESPLATDAHLQLSALAMSGYCSVPRGLSGCEDGFALREQKQ